MIFWTPSGSLPTAVASQINPKNTQQLLPSHWPWKPRPSKPGHIANCCCLKYGVIVTMSNKWLHVIHVISSYQHSMMTFWRPLINKLVSIHLEDKSFSIGRPRIHHQPYWYFCLRKFYSRRQAKDICPPTVVANLLRETGRIIPLHTRWSHHNIYESKRENFKAYPPSEDQRRPILLHIKEWLKSQRQ